MIKKLQKEEGSVGDLLSTGFCVLAMVTLMLCFFECMGYLHQKQEIGQVAREYVLRMEVDGMLTPDQETRLCQKLTEVGLTEIDLCDTTRNAPGYGQEILLHFRGKIRGQLDVEEKRATTAKY